MEMEMERKSDNRAERRKRIMSREMDRMAVITGRLRNLPPSPPPSPSSPSLLFVNQHHRHHQRGHSHTGISPSFFSKDQRSSPDSLPLSHLHSISNSKDEKVGALLKRMSSNEGEVEEKKGEMKDKKLEPIVEGGSNNNNNNAIIMSTPSVNPYLSMVELKKKGSSIDYKEEAESKSSKWKGNKVMFTSKRVNSCIISSERTRVLCSVIIASLAVLSHVDQPALLVFIIRNMVRSESLVASKPLYILLLTDATIVVATMLAQTRHKGGDDDGDQQQQDQIKSVLMKEDNNNNTNNGHNWDSAVKLLERGLVFYQAFRAIFIDFSVYAVVLICGLSLL